MARIRVITRQAPANAGFRNDAYAAETGYTLKGSGRDFWAEKDKIVGLIKGAVAKNPQGINLVEWSAGDVELGLYFDWLKVYNPTADLIELVLPCFPDDEQERLRKVYGIRSVLSIPLIITRHQGAVAWLEAQGITGEVISHVASADEVRGRIVIGPLPLYLAAATEKIGSIDMPGLRLDQRGQDLTPEQMDAAGAVLRWYVVRQSN